MGTQWDGFACSFREDAANLRRREENNEAVLEQSAFPPGKALFWEPRLRKPW